MGKQECQSDNSQWRASRTGLRVPRRMGWYLINLRYNSRARVLVGKAWPAEETWDLR